MRQLRASAPVLVLVALGCASTKDHLRLGDEALAAGLPLDAISHYRTARVRAGASPRVDEAERRAEQVWVQAELAKARAVLATNPKEAWQRAHGILQTPQWPTPGDRATVEALREDAAEAWLARLDDGADARFDRGEAAAVWEDVEVLKASVQPKDSLLRGAESLQRRAFELRTRDVIQAADRCSKDGRDARSVLATLSVEAPESWRADIEQAAIRARTAVAVAEVAALLKAGPPASPLLAAELGWWRQVADKARSAESPELARQVRDARRAWLKQRLAAIPGVPSVIDVVALRSVVEDDPEATEARARFEAALSSFRARRAAATGAASALLWTNVLHALGASEAPPAELVADVERERARFEPNLVVFGESPACRGILELSGWNVTDRRLTRGPAVVVDASGVTCEVFDGGEGAVEAGQSKVVRQQCRLESRTATVLVDRPCGQETVIRNGGTSNQWGYIRERSCKVEETVEWKEEVCGRVELPGPWTPSKLGLAQRTVRAKGDIVLKSGGLRTTLSASFSDFDKYYFSAGEPPPTLMDPYSIARGRRLSFRKEAMAAAEALLRQAAEPWLSATLARAAANTPDGDAARDLLLAVAVDPVIKSGRVIPRSEVLSREVGEFPVKWMGAAPPPPVDTPVLTEPPLPQCEVGVPLPKGTRAPLPVFPREWKEPEALGLVEEKAPPAPPSKLAGTYGLPEAGIRTSLVAPGTLETTLRFEYRDVGRSNHDLGMRLVLDAVLPFPGPGAGGSILFDVNAIKPKVSYMGAEPGPALRFGMSLGYQRGPTLQAPEFAFTASASTQPFGPFMLEADLRLNLVGLARLSADAVGPSFLTGSLLLGPADGWVARVHATAWTVPATPLTYGVSIGRVF